MSHKDVYALLPWYVNGTLETDQRQAVETELATCRQCAAEVQELKSMQNAVVDVNERFPEPSPFLLSRALSRVEEFEREKEVERQFLRGWWRRQLPVVASILLAVPLVFVAAFAAVIAARSFNAAVPEATPAPGGQPITVSFDNTKVAAAGRLMEKPAPPVALQTQTNGAIAPLTGRSQVMKRGDISLFVVDVEPAIHSLYRIASVQGGDIAKLQDQTPNRPGERHTAQIEMRVPAKRFDTAMDAVAGVGRVTTRNAAAEDVSDQLIDLQARLRNLRHTESDLLHIMDRSGKIGEVLDVENQLSSVREQIEQLDAQLKSTQIRVAYSTVDVALSDEVAAAKVEPSFGSRVGDIWKTALAAVKDFSVILVGMLLWLVAFGPYIIIAALIATVAWFTIRRRLQTPA
jgi:hypothetical protein